jgi:Early transcription elongation factor of RNA pol II, NGN section
VGQQGLLPTKSDARLWAVQCKPGAEREAVVCLLQKAVEFAARNERLGMGALGIKSAFAHDHIKVHVGPCCAVELPCHKLQSCMLC